MATIIQEFDRSKFKGLKFEFICDEKYLTIQESPEKAIEWFTNYSGVAPVKVVQVSRYPARRC